jgi:hypothetical protein
LTSNQIGRQLRQAFVPSLSAQRYSIAKFRPVGSRRERGIPVVAINAGDPVRTGLVESLAHPNELSSVDLKEFGGSHLLRWVQEGANLLTVNIGERQKVPANAW